MNGALKPTEWGAERDCGIETFAERQAPDVGRHERRSGGSRPVASRCLGKHPQGRVDADDVPVGHHAGHRPRDISVAAPHVEDALVAGESQGGCGLCQGLFCHRALQRTDVGVVLAAPVGHTAQYLIAVEICGHDPRSRRSGDGTVIALMQTRFNERDPSLP